MRPPNIETNELDVEEFRRLGVRLNECRLPVLRQAAARVSKSLADLQLVSPTSDRQRELSMVVTSAYRVLDPRKRTDFIQRILVGRLQPDGVSWSGQQNFRIDVAESRNNAIDSEGASEDDSFALDETSLSRTPFMVQTRATVANWTQSLDSQDLIEAGARRRRLANVRNSIQHPWMILSLFGLLLATLFGVAKVDFGPEEYYGPGEYRVFSGEIAMQDDAETTSVDGLLPSVEPEQAVVATLPDETSNHVASKTTASAVDTVAAVTDRDASESSSASDLNATSDPMAAGAAVATTSLDIASAAVPTTVAPLATDAVTNAVPEVDALDLAIDESLAALAAANEVSPSPAAAASDMSDAHTENPPMLADSDAAEFLPDPFAIVESEVVEFEFPSSLDVLSQVDLFSDLIEASVDEPKLAALPSSTRQLAARAKLKSRFPAIGTRLLPVQISELITQLQDLLTEQVADSDDAYVMQLAIAEYAWLVEDAAKVEAHVNELAKVFAVNSDETLVQTYLASLAIADLDETKRFLARNGFVLAERLLTNESLQQSDVVVRGADRLVNAINDEQLSLDARRLTQTIELSTKMSATVVRPDAIPFASDLDLGVAGRYYCLMLRNWDQGLPWLAKVSDARIASLVKQELALTKTSSITEWNALADRWRNAADRSDGRSADSIRTHVVAIKRRIVAEADGLQKLELQREISKLESELPFYIVKLGEWQTPKPIAAPESRKSVPIPALVDAATGMIGQVMIDGRPTHFRIVYMPGGVLTPEALTQYSAIYSLKEQSVEIEFSGQLQLSTPMEVRLISSSAGRHRYGEVRVDGEVVPLDGDSEYADLWLDSGSHQLQWRVRVTPLANEYFRVQDVLTRGELNLTHSKVMQ